MRSRNKPGAQRQLAQTTAMHLPAEILAEMLPPVLGRLLSRELRARIDASVTSVRLRPGTPAAVLRKLVLQEWCATLERVSLRGVSCVDDELLAEVLDSVPSLRSLDVSGCEQLRHASLPRLQGSALQSWAAEGCWRMLRPCSQLSPETALRAQYTALQNNGDLPFNSEGVRACFEFASPSNRAATGPLERFAQMLHSGYPVMLDASATIAVERVPPSALHAQLGDGHAVFLVEYRRPSASTVVGDRELQHFAWMMELQGVGCGVPELHGCWMTSGVMPLDAHAVQQLQQQVALLHQ